MQGKIPEILNTELMPVISYLASNGYRSGCEQCGSTDSYVSCCEVNGDARTLCQNCLTQLEAALQNNREQKRAKKSNLVPGLVGAFLGALIGVVLWVLAGKLGYINIISWVTIIMDCCALKGYEMCIRDRDKVAIEIAEECGRYLGWGLANLAAVTDPAMIVIGGGVSKAGDILLSFVEKPYREHAFFSNKRIKFGLATLGNEAGICGSAKLILDDGQ